MRIERSGDGRRTARAKRDPRPDGISRRVASAAREDQADRAQLAPAETTERPKPLHQLGRVGVPSAPVRRKPLTKVLAGLIGAVAIVGGGVLIVLSAARQRVPAPDPSPSGSVGVTSSPTSSSPIPMTATSPSGSAPTSSTAAQSVQVNATAATTNADPGDPGFGWPAPSFGSTAAPAVP